MFFKRQIFQSQLFSEKDFYKQFLKDLSISKSEIIIESPFITSSRMNQLMPIFQVLLDKGKKIHIVTRDPSEIDEEHSKLQATNEILNCADFGINTILMKGYHHRKICIIDRQILWEGSLNILSHANNSREVMRRINGEYWAIEMINFLKLDSVLVSQY